MPDGVERATGIVAKARVCIVNNNVRICLLLATAIAIMPFRNACATDPTTQAATAPIVMPDHWALRLPAQDQIVVNGVVSYDTAGLGTAGMLYPASDAVSLLAVIATHGVMVRSMKRKQRAKFQDEANQVLTPYLPVLEGYTHRTLLSDALALQPFGLDKRIIGPDEKAVDEWVVVSMPTFQLTQDQRAFIIDNAIALYEPGSPSKPAFRNTVRVVSATNAEENPEAYWIANQGERLRKEWANLFSESIEVAMHAYASGPGDNGAAFKTVRYTEGGSAKMERAQPLYESCARIMARSLRGTLLSAPIVNADGAQDGACTAGAPQ